MTVHDLSEARHSRRRTAHGRPAPYNDDAEREALGSMLYNPASVAIVLPLINPTDFYEPAHHLIAAAIYDAAADSEPVDPTTIAERLERAGDLERVGGRAYLIDLQAGGCVASVVANRAGIIARHARSRQIMAIAGGLGEQVADGIDPAVIAGKLKDDVDQLIGVTNRRNRLFNAADLVLDHLDVIAQRGDNPEDKTLGIRLGWRELDDIIGGLRAGQLVVVAGRPGMGKSAAAAGMALRAALKLGLRVLTVSIEMSMEELLDRYVAASARLDLTKVRSGQLPTNDWARANDAALKFTDRNLWVLDDPTATLPSIHAAAQRIEADLVIVDYLQIVDTIGGAGSKNRTREREVAELSGGLKRMARDLSVPVVALSQFNRDLESRHADKRPQLTDLRESGAIENDADVVIGLYRDDYYNNPDALSSVLEMIVLKQRNGPTGVARLFFEPPTGRIGNLVRKQF